MTGMNTLKKTLIFSMLALAAALPAQATVRIVSATADLASIAEMVGGDKVKVETICRGSADPHFVEILPSYMVKVARADIYLKVGLDLDFWSTQIIDGSGNGEIHVVDCSSTIEPLEVPNTAVNPSMGDVHIKGNPHYWLDPQNGLHIAEAITDALLKVDAGNSDYYNESLQEFRRQLEVRVERWRARAATFNGIEIVMYHNSWPYFSRAFDIKVIGFVEPKPGIEPTPSHTAQLIDLIRSRGVPVIGKEPYFSDRAPKAIARHTDAVVIELPTSVGGVKEAKDYFLLFDSLINRLSESLGGS
jgi:ABC-type Zn uptake system ZnuABC Zn-binding protein ZnuA